MKKLLCKIFGHRMERLEKAGEMWAITYVRHRCKRCGHLTDPFIKLYED